jgi:hypothetical protein
MYIFSNFSHFIWWRYKTNNPELQNIATVLLPTVNMRKNKEGHLWTTRRNICKNKGIGIERTSMTIDGIKDGHRG